MNWTKIKTDLPETRVKEKKSPELTFDKTILMVVIRRRPLVLQLGIL